MKFVESLPKNLNKNILGIDETGVGDYFTPLIACGALLPKEMHQWAVDLGVKDSKLLSENKIKEIAQELKSKIPHAVYVLSQQGYNTMVNKKFNANEIKFFAHANAILNFDKKYKIANKEILIDKYSTIKAIEKYSNRFLFIESFQEICQIYNEIYLEEKAESKCLSVACASIIARAYLIEYMEKQTNEWNFVFPLGANTSVKQAVLKFKELHGQDSLNKVAKTSFKI